MADTTPQSFQNHAKIDPVFHRFLLPVAAANFFIEISRLWRAPSFNTGWSVLVAFTFIVAIFLIRVYSLKVQDRLIRLEERLRLQTLLGEGRLPQIMQLNEKQLVALRFASDGEVGSLVEQALKENLGTKQIKERIKTWRPDHFRV